MIAGPDGVGKTTLGQQLALRVAGIGGLDLLGHMVTPDPDRKVLYLALDRPRQAARSMRRMVDERDRLQLERGLVVWLGAFPFDLVDDPTRLVAFAQDLGAGMVVIDCLKDLGAALSDEIGGQAINNALQRCVEERVEVLALHHQRKASAEQLRDADVVDVVREMTSEVRGRHGREVQLFGEPPPQCAPGPHRVIPKRGCAPHRGDEGTFVGRRVTMWTTKCPAIAERRGRIRRRLIA
jgi:replicative DNA helicase